MLSPEHLQAEHLQLQMKLDEALASKDTLQAECSDLKEKIRDLQIIVDEVC